MKIVVLDGYAANPGDLDWSPLATLGELTVHERTPAGLTIERAAGAQVLLTNKVVLGAVEMAALPEFNEGSLNIGATTLPRITSYNVCYTKLLRPAWPSAAGVEKC